MKVLVIGPSSTKSKGGMATVIKEIEEDEELCDKFSIDSYASYVDGNKIKVLIYSVCAFLWFCISKRGYDVYHIHAASRGSTFRKGYYVRIAKIWGKKVVLHIHGAQYMEFYNEINESKKKRVISILKSANKVIALSNDWKHKFDSTFGLQNCVSVENGINMKKLASAIRPVEGCQKNFLMLGRLGQRKGTYDLVAAVEKAVKLIPDLRCYLAGDGEIGKVKNLVVEKKLENNLEVVGWADFDKKLELLQKVSTVVLPSYNEGLPMSVLEGMACGKAIISTKVGAIPEVVMSENGILVQPGDVIALADAMIRICSDSNYVENVSVENINKIQKQFSMKVMHEKIAKCYESTM